MRRRLSLRRRLAAASVAALALTGLAACGSDDDPGSDSASDTGVTSDSIDGLEVTGEFGEEPQIEVDGLDVEEVQSALLIEGDGEEAPADGIVLVHSIFAVAADGETVSSSYEQENPQSVTLDQTQDYFKDALTGATVGSRIAMALPADDYFQGQIPEGSGVTAEDDLVIVLDLIDLADPPLDGPEGEQVDPPADAPQPEVEGDDATGDVTGVDFSGAPEEAPGELQVIPLIEGEGAAVEENAQVTVDYYGVVWGADEPFDQSYTRGEPASFTLAQGSLIDGWVEGLQGVNVGSRVMLVVPPEKGYGDQEQNNIPASSTLVFVVDVLGTTS